MPTQQLQMALIPANSDSPVTLTHVTPDWQTIATSIDAQFIERVHIDDGWSLIVDEEGLLTNRTENPRAMLLYPGRIVGDALLAREAFDNHGALDWIDAPATELIGYLARRGVQ